MKSESKEGLIQKTRVRIRMSEKKVVRRRKVRRKKKQKTIDKKIWMIIGGIILGLVIVYLAISVFF